MLFLHILATQSNSLKNKDWATVIFLSVLIFGVLIKWVFPKNCSALRKLRKYLLLRDNFVLFTLFIWWFIIFTHALWLWSVAVFYKGANCSSFLFLNFPYVAFFWGLLSVMLLFLNKLVLYQLGKKHKVSLFYKVKLLYELRFSFFLLLSAAVLVYTAPFYPELYKPNFILVAFLFVLKYLLCTRDFSEITHIPAVLVFFCFILLEILPVFLFLRFFFIW